MKRFTRGIYTVGILACCMIFFWGRTKLSARFLTPKSYNFQFSGSFSRGQKAKIKDFVFELAQKKAQPLHNVCAQLEKRFPSIKSLSLTRDASDNLCIAIGGDKPFFLLNEQFVLTHDGSLFHRVLFEKDSLVGLCRVSCRCLETCEYEVLFGNEQEDHVDKLPSDFLQTIKQIPEDRFDDYEILCEHKKRWHLKDKAKTNFSILCTDETISDQRLICACNKVKGILVARDSRFERGIRSWVVDARFDGQVVLFRKTGGR